MLYLAYSLLTNVLISRADGHQTVLVLLLLINLWPAVALISRSSVRPPAVPAKARAASLVPA